MACLPRGPHVRAQGAPLCKKGGGSHPGQMRFKGGLFSTRSLQSQRFRETRTAGKTRSRPRSLLGVHGGCSYLLLWKLFPSQVWHLGPESLFHFILTSHKKMENIKKNFKTISWTRACLFVSWKQFLN